jgi:hypothetical protein
MSDYTHAFLHELCKAGFGGILQSLRHLERVFQHDPGPLPAMGLANTEEEWGTRASAFLKAKMKEADITMLSWS